MFKPHEEVPKMQTADKSFLFLMLWHISKFCENIDWFPNLCILKSIMFYYLSIYLLPFYFFNEKLQGTEIENQTTIRY